MSLIVYLHGFASVGHSDKSRALAAALPEHHLVCPDLPLNPAQVVAQVEGILAAHDRQPGDKLVFVGTSLGGFWSTYFAHKHGGIGVVVNPATAPSVTMAARLGGQFHNYVTGAPITITAADIEQFSALEEELRVTGGDHGCCHLFLAEDDDVLDYRLALAFYRQVASKTIMTRGGHRFTEHWSLVVERVKALLDEKV